MSDPHPELVEELLLAEETREVLGALGTALEPWEALRLARTEGEHLRREVKRLARQREQGRCPSVGHLLQEAVQRIRLAMYRRAQVLREMTENSGLGLDPRKRDLLVALLLNAGASPLLSEVELRGWAERAERARIEMKRRQRGGSPAAPAGLDADLLEDLRAADRFIAYQDRKLQKIELWEVFLLSMSDREAAGRATERLRRGAEPDDLNADLIRFLERILEVRSREGALARRLREYVATLPIGRYNADLMEMAMAFTMAHGEAKSRVQQWLEMPEHWKREAAIRYEGVIGKAQKYQQALRAAAS
jgi:hypothetical protein